MDYPKYVKLDSRLSATMTSDEIVRVWLNPIVTGVHVGKMFRSSIVLLNKDL